jgi:hypothetical protein
VGSDQPVNVALHVRRGDKVSSREAEKVNMTHYVRACFAAGQSNAARVLVLSDDISAGPEFAEHWTLLGGSNNTNVTWRTAVFRPDKFRPYRAVNRNKRVDEVPLSVLEARMGFWWLLVDLRIMVDADVFVGSQSSNLGALVCALRAWTKCWSAENYMREYAWDTRRYEKIARS